MLGGPVLPKSTNRLARGWAQWGDCGNLKILLRKICKVEREHKTKIFTITFGGKKKKGTHQEFGPFSLQRSEDADGQGWGHGGGEETRRSLAAIFIINKYLRSSTVFVSKLKVKKGQDKAQEKSMDEKSTVSQFPTHLGWLRSWERLLGGCEAGKGGPRGEGLRRK